MPSEAAPGPGDGPADEAAEEPEDDGLGDPVLDEEAQYRVVPPPKPHVEAKLRKEAKQVPHILLHKPFNKYCEICNQAKLNASIVFSGETSEEPLCATIILNPLKNN